MITNFIAHVWQKIVIVNKYLIKFVKKINIFEKIHVFLKKALEIFSTKIICT